MPGVLFLCTGNSARSILAEATLNHLGHGRYRAFSAGSHPTGVVNPAAIALLRQLGIPTEALRSKSWDEFAAAGAPAIDIVITVCDSAASEVCPVWPGHPLSAHWGVPDPAHVAGDAERATAFRAAQRVLAHRIDLLLQLPEAQLHAPTFAAELRAIGRAAPPPDAPAPTDRRRRHARGQ